MWENLSQSKLSYVSLPCPGAVYSSVLLSNFLFRNLKTRLQPPSPQRNQKTQTKNPRVCAIVCDSSCFFWKEELAVSWYIFRSSQATRVRRLRAFFPLFLSGHMCSNFLSWEMSVSFFLSPQALGVFVGVQLVFLFGYFFIQRELSNQLQEWHMWGKRSILVCRLSRTQKRTLLMFACSKRQIHFIIYGQTEIMFYS